MMAKKILRVVLPLIVVAAGAGVAMKLVKTRPKAKRAKMSKAALVVEVMQARPETATTTVTGMGTVVPERTVTLQAQVGGELVHESPDFEVGGRLRRGETVARIDATEHELAVKQREADVARAKFEIQLEKGRRAVASREWKLLDKSIKASADGKRLALRLPHKELAAATLSSAQSALARAKLNVRRTKVQAPFDAIVRAARASVGPLVGPGRPQAARVSPGRDLGTVSVPMDKLSWLAVPGLNADVEHGARARISQQTGAAPSLRSGVVTRVLGDLDAAGRMARVVVAVDRPLALGDKAKPGDADSSAADKGLKPAGEQSGATAKLATLPLLLGAYVRVDIDGRKLHGVYRVPRMALREGDTVWIADAKDALEIRKIDIVWRQKQAVLARGLNPGERIITSRIPSPVPGMAVRTRDKVGRKLAAGDANKPKGGGAGKSARPGGPPSQVKAAPKKAPSPPDRPDEPEKPASAPAKGSE